MTAKKENQLGISDNFLPYDRILPFSSVSYFLSVRKIFSKILIKFQASGGYGADAIKNACDLSPTYHVSGRSYFQ